MPVLVVAGAHAATGAAVTTTMPSSVRENVPFAVVMSSVALYTPVCANVKVGL